MGEAIAKQDIASINEDVDDQCNYCKAATSTAAHIRWACTLFNGVRTKFDPQLANVPSDIYSSVLNAVSLPP